MTKADKQAYAECVEDMPYCLLCGSWRDLHIHHIFHNGTRKTFKGNLIRLCKSCHDLTHSNNRKYQPILIDKINKLYGMKIDRNRKHFYIEE